MKLSDLASKLGLELHNPKDVSIVGAAPLDKATGETLTFFSNVKYRDKLKETKAAVCIIAQDYLEHLPPSCAALVSSNPYYDYARSLYILYPQEAAMPKVSERASISAQVRVATDVTIADYAVVEDGAELATGVVVGAGAYIGKNCVIGEGTIIGKNAVIENAVIGKACNIYSGVCIGQDGFGFAPHDRGILKIIHLGRVIIGDHVEIGANTTIDRGALEDTVIGSHTKIDNLVQIGHNCIIGNYCFICGQVGFAGSTTVEDGVMIGGQAGLAGHITIGKGAKIAAQGGVMTDIAPGQVVGGSPCMPIKDWHKSTIMIKNMIKTKKQGNS